MAAIANRTEFLSIVTESKLIDDDVLADLRLDSNLSDRPSECAEQLIQRGLLTRFQTRQLLAGKYRGFVLGPYRLLDQIGKGGMGTVFLAEHSTLKRRVAVKVLARELAENKVAVDRFLREARSASALAHPNIVRVHHVGQAGGTHYIAMEYVDGVTLEQVVDRKGPFTVAEVAQIALQAAAGLQHAHERGFVHRDIKPENLMITKNGQVKILDMGLTKSVINSSDNLTGLLNTTTILGTLDYLSPEQAIQNEATPQSDLYSLGATLFMLLTGHSPYDGVPAKQKLMQHQFGAVPNLLDHRPDAPEEFAAVLTKMMAKKLEDRYQSAIDVAEALAPWFPQDGAAANINLPSRVMANPNVSHQSLTPTVRDAATKTAVDSKPAPRTEIPVAPKAKSSFSIATLPNRSMTKTNLKPVETRGIPIRVWAFLVLLGMAIGLGVAIAVAKLI